MERKKKYQYYFVYTLLFLGISGFMTWIFWTTDHSFVWSKDGAAQHYPTLVYIHRYIREFAGNLLHGRWQVPMVDFSIGEGMDILTTLNYYGFGDPLTLTAAFCPEGYLEQFYGFLIFVRMYLTGIFFSVYCFEKGNIQRVCVIVGALAYVFCGYSLYAAVRHPFFVNGMMYLPLYLLGVEFMIRRRRKGFVLFAAVVALSLVSNFYFGYMNTVMMALYVLFWMLPERSLEWGKRFRILGEMVAGYLCGVMLSAVIMLPMVGAYLSCSRGGEGGYKDSLFFYPEEFYQDFVRAYTRMDTYVGQWTNLGFSVFSLAAVVVLFVHRSRGESERRRNMKLRVGYLVLTLMLLVPLAGKIMNGFGYVSNRWNYAYAMLNSYILVCMLPEFLRYLRLFRMPGGGRLHIRNWKGNRLYVSLAVCMMVVFNLVLNVAQMYLNSELDYLDEFDRAGTVAGEAERGAVSAVEALEPPTETSFYRVEQPWIIGNQSLLKGYYGHNWYFSIAPEWYFAFYNSLQLNSMERTYSLRGLDGRTVLNEITATRYYVTQERGDCLVPYGYELVKAVENGREISLEEAEEKESEGEASLSYVYENKYFLPLGYTVSSWIREDEYNALSPIEKQEALLQSVVVEEEQEDLMHTLPRDATALPMDVMQEFCRVADSNGLTWENNQICVTEKNATITLQFQGRPNSETYLWLNEFQVEKSARKYQTGTVESGDTRNHFVLMDPEKSAWYDEPNQTIHLGYSKEPRKSCTIIFPEKGIYSLDDFVVVYESMDAYESKAQALKADHLENVKVSPNKIQGDITLSKTKLLQMAVPYSTGWKAYINGREAPVLRSNKMYMALELSAGDSHVEFVYETPYLRMGCVVSVVGIAILLYASVIRKAMRRSKKL